MNNEDIEQNLIQNCFVETYKHVKLVSKNINVFIKELIYRSENHDNSKFEEPELSIYAKFTPELAKTEYGSKEYKELLEKVKPAIEHHYEKNQHHIEYSKFKEEWKDIKGYKGCYQISNFGQIRSVERMLNRDYNNNLYHAEKILKPHLTPRGYLRIQISKNGIHKNYLVHRLVAEAFIENPQNKKAVNHKNSIRTDNHIANLEWVTHSENLQEAYDSGLKFSRPKYIIRCKELDIVTIGIPKMVKALWKAGYEKVDGPSIWTVLNDENSSHLDLHFESFNLQEFKESVYLNRLDLIDLLEIICDWGAACKRTKDGNIKKSMKINFEKYGFSPQLRKILENTVERYF